VSWPKEGKQQPLARWHRSEAGSRSRSLREPNQDATGWEDGAEIEPSIGPCGACSGCGSTERTAVGGWLAGSARNQRPRSWLRRFSGWRAAQAGRQGPPASGGSSAGEAEAAVIRSRGQPPPGGPVVGQDPARGIRGMPDAVAGRGMRAAWKGSRPCRRCRSASSSKPLGRDPRRPMAPSRLQGVRPRQSKRWWLAISELGRGPIAPGRRHAPGGLRFAGLHVVGRRLDRGWEEDRQGRGPVGLVTAPVRHPPGPSPNKGAPPPGGMLRAHQPCELPSSRAGLSTNRAGGQGHGIGKQHPLLRFRPAGPGC